MDEKKKGSAWPWILGGGAVAGLIALARKGSAAEAPAAPLIYPISNPQPGDFPYVTPSQAAAAAVAKVQEQLKAQGASAQTIAAASGAAASGAASGRTQEIIAQLKGMDKLLRDTLTLKGFGVVPAATVFGQGETLVAVDPSRADQLTGALGGNALLGDFQFFMSENKKLFAGGPKFENVAYMTGHFGLFQRLIDFFNAL